VKLFESIRGIFGGGRSTAQLAKWLGVPEDELREWRKGRPPEPRGLHFSYTQFEIPKRRGGTRTIDAPSEALKDLQRRILRRMLNPLPVHPAATGFVRGRSIVDNARPHAGCGVVINIDLADFFPSITAERVRATFRALGWGGESAGILTNICTHEGRLPQGAPTSPAISNLACRKLDARLEALMRSKKLRLAVRRNPQTGEITAETSSSQVIEGAYTRYADDLTFSLAMFGRNKRRRPRPKDKPKRPRVVAPSRALLTHIRKIIEDEGFTIQKRKRVRVQRAHQRQTATGLVVNAKVSLPREVRRRIRAMQHRERKGVLDAKGKAALRGWEALAGMVVRQRGRSLPGAGV
jgi:retron-type reverse transcriptase